MIERLAYNLEFDRPHGPGIIENLKTHIGERFNVILSSERFDVRNDRIYAQNGQEPFAEVVKRGRDYRRNCSSSVDYEREDAEVTGFEKIEQILTSPQTPEGSMVISISPPGGAESSYRKNFYDVFTKTEEGITLNRYSSGLSNSEYAGFLLEMGFSGKGEEASDAFFLANPVRILDPRFETAKDLHKYLHKEHGYTTREDFEERIRICLPLILDYAENPTANKFNAILNLADMPEKKFLGAEMLGKLPVREVMTGCGASCGISSGSGYSVSEYGTKVRPYEFDSKGPCRVCGSESLRGPVGICEKCNDKFDSGELAA